MQIHGLFPFPAQTQTSRAEHINRSLQPCPPACKDPKPHSLEPLSHLHVLTCKATWSTQPRVCSLLHKHGATNRHSDIPGTCPPLPGTSFATNLLLLSSLCHPDANPVPAALAPLLSGPLSKVKHSHASLCTPFLLWAQAQFMVLVLVLGKTSLPLSETQRPWSLSAADFPMFTCS